MLEYMPAEVLSLCIDSIQDATVASLPRMYSIEYETGLFAFDGAASDDRFVAVGSRLRPNLKALKGAVDSLSAKGEYPIVVVSPSLDYWQKEWLVSKRIPFIQDERNAYLPFLGLVLRETSRGRRPSALSPQAQRVVVNLIEGNWNRLNAGELSKRLGKSRASVSKYLAEIEAVCPEAVRRKGRAAMLCSDGMEKGVLLDCFEPYLRSPVSRRLRISNGVGPDELAAVGARLAGFSALGMMSDLAVSGDYPVVALPQERLSEALSGFGEEGEELPWWDEEGTEVEVWGYWDDYPTDLYGHAFGGLEAVGGLSLYLSLRDRYEDDERVADAVDQLREDICR
ncbi:MAG: hypothetical protein IKG21_01900 [Atopobiaceae bacterium]|nr:hypothetical protein [Atopobiaceae bacterium]